jgi:RNA polymerase sigma factor (sigma-70 family)
MVGGLGITEPMGPLVAQPAERAFDGLYRRHRADVYRYALALLNNPADAEDVTQTAFMNAFRALRRGEDPREPRNWLIAIAHNVCRERFRQSARRPFEVEFDESFADAASDEAEWTVHDIRRALAHLGFNQRAALVLREVEGRSYAEIGAILGLSLPAVEALVFRARRALREQLEGGLSCARAERAIAQQLDGRLARADRGELRAHLRACRDCATLAKSRRGRARTLGRLASLLPFPLPLKSLSGGPGGAVAVGSTGGAVAGKAAAVALVALVAAGGGYRGFEGRGAEGPAAGAPAEQDALGERRGSATAGTPPGSLASQLPTGDVVSGGWAATAYRAVPGWRGGSGSHDGRRAHVTRRWPRDAGETARGPATAPGQPVPKLAERPDVPDAATTETSSAAAVTTAAGPVGPHAAAPNGSDIGAPATVEHAAVVGIRERAKGDSQAAVAGGAVASSEETVPVERAAGPAQAVTAHVAPKADKEDKAPPEKSEKPKADKEDKAPPEKSEKPKADKEDKAPPEKSEKQAPVKAEQPKSEESDKREDAKPAPDKGEKPTAGNGESRKADTSEKPEAEKAASDKSEKPPPEKNEQPENDEKPKPDESQDAVPAVPLAHTGAAG